MLDLLERGPAAVETRLDWAVKRALYTEYIRRRSQTWESLRAWSAKLATLLNATRENNDNVAEPPSHSLELLLRAAAERGMDPDRLRDFLNLRNDLFEIDMRFGLLGGDGLFAALERDGALEHGIDGVGSLDIERAMSEPPLRTRARLRGDTIARLAHENGWFEGDWTGLWNRDRNTRLDLRDPFEAQERWVPGTSASS
jgi:hypothetical protein